MYTKKLLPPFLMLDGEPATGSSTPPAPAPTPTPPAGETKPAEGETPDQTIARLTAERDKANREADQARVNAKAKVAEDAKKDQLLAVAKALGIEVPDAGKETVESLTEKLTAEQGKTQQTEAEKLKVLQGRAIDRAAWANKIDIGLSEYLEFKLQNSADFGALDSSAADYQTKVTALVKGLIDTDPIFKATPGGTTKSGAESFGGAGGADSVTQEDFDKMSIQDQTKLYQTNPDLFRRLTGAA